MLVSFLSILFFDWLRARCAQSSIGSDWLVSGLPVVLVFSGWLMGGRKRRDYIGHPSECAARSSWALPWVPAYRTLTRDTWETHKFYYHQDLEILLHYYQRDNNPGEMREEWGRSVLTFPSHGQLIEEIWHEVSSTGCCYHWEREHNAVKQRWYYISMAFLVQWRETRTVTSTVATHNINSSASEQLVVFISCSDEPHC